MMMKRLEPRVKEGLTRGNYTDVIKVLEAERETLRDFLESCKEDMVKETQGKCVLLSDLIKLLKQ